MLSMKILDKALSEVSKSNFDKFKLCAIVFRGKRIVSIGVNQIRSCSKLDRRYKKWQESLHAEQNAIIKAGMNNIKRCSILVIRINKIGNLCMARPCPLCYSMIQDSGISDIFYSDSTGQIIRERVHK